MGGDGHPLYMGGVQYQGRHEGAVTWLFKRRNMKTMFYLILFVIVTPLWWVVMQTDMLISKLHMHILIKLMEGMVESNDKNE